MSASHIVPPPQIQKELDALWNGLENKNKMRASLFNVIFYTKRTLRDEYTRKIAQKLIEKFPARIFFISSDMQKDTDYVKTAVAVLTTEQGEFDITCDFIECSVGGKGELQIPFILLPHIIPDLPTFLVWGEDPTLQNPLCEELQMFATRVIFDSETAEDLAKFAQAVTQVREGSRCEVADLNWARIESWRDLMIDTFEDSDRMDKLKKATSVTITFNAQESQFFCHTKIQSIYLQAWIASRLKWTPKSSSSKSGVKTLVYQCEGRDITIDLVEARHNLPPGLILAVDIETPDEEHFLFTRNLTEIQQISFEQTSKHACNLPTKFLIAKGESGQSLIKEICHKGTSQHYLEVLALITKWGVQLLC